MLRLVRRFGKALFSFETDKKGSQDSGSRLLHAHNGLRSLRPPFGTYSTPHPFPAA